VIEAIMIFALGFLAATLLALLVIPALNARAERLARRRAEALFPLSISELTAEKDHLRAEFAVMQRRIERKAEEALATKHQSMEELGRRAVRIEALETTLAERDQHISNLQNDIADLRHRLAGTEQELSATKVTLSTTRDTLAAVENAHRRTLEDLANTRAELERTNTTLAGTRAELGLTQDKLAARESAFVDLEQRHTEALGQLDAKRITISDLETRLATQTARGDEFERTLTERHGELSDERRRLADLAKNLIAEQERGLVLDQRIRELEAERDEHAAEATSLSERLTALTAEGGGHAALLEQRDESVRALEWDPEEARARLAASQGSSDGNTELRTLSDRYEDLKAEKASLEGALAAAREERAKLAREMKALRRSAGTPPEEIRAENAELRRRIDEIADQMMRGADTPERSAASDRRTAAR
jgi:chromosome segregation ATPase